MKVLCTKCQNHTEHTLHSEFVKNEDDDKHQWIQEERYQIVICAGCKTATFRYMYTDSELQYINSHEGANDEDDYDIKLYPIRGMHLLKTKVFYNAEFIKQIYAETIEAYNSGQYLLCSGGLRAIVEGICIDKGIESGMVEYIGKGGTKDKKKSKSLNGKINELLNQGYINPRSADALHELRFLGNGALHALEVSKATELKVAINLIEHIIDNIYEFADKIEGLKKARPFKKDIE